MLALIDYGYGNVRSVKQALSAVCASEIILTNSPDIISKADKIILPGVGAFAQCMGALCAIDGLVETLNQRVIVGKTPFLGICVGMQLLADKGVEFETTQGLGWIKGEVTRLMPNDETLKIPHLKIPHMGWNEAIPQNNGLFDKAWNGRAEDVYYVHSYAFRCADKKDIAATCQYGQDVFAAAVQKDNIFGVQFHPEKSQKAGLKLLQTWIENND